MSVYSQRLLTMDFGSTGVDGGPDPGYVWVVRDISGATFASGGGIQAVLAGVIMYVAEIDTLPAGGIASFQWTGRQVLTYGDLMYINPLSGSDGAVVSGYVLTA